MSNPQESHVQEIPLRRVITLPWLILYGLGSTVGAGIYVLTGVVAGKAGLHSPLAFAVASLIALGTAMSFAQLSARFPTAGGALVYVREGTGSPTLSIAVGLLSATAGVISAATVSLGFVGYLTQLVSAPSLFTLFIVVISVGSIAAWGVRESVIAAGVVTMIEVAGLIAVIAFGTVHLDGQAHRVVVLLPIGLDATGWTAIMGSVVLCFYAFLGFEDIVNVAEEVRDVRRVLPKAILWTLGLSTTLYVSVTAVSVLVVPPLELAQADAPLALVFERAGGSPKLLALIALIAMLNGALIQIIMASRILFSLARQRQLPSWLGRVHQTTQTPVYATGLVTTAIFLLAAYFELDGLASATASIALLVFSLVNFSLVLVLARTPNERHLRQIWIPATAGLVSVAFLIGEIVTIVRNATDQL